MKVDNTIEDKLSTDNSIERMLEKINQTMTEFILPHSFLFCCFQYYRNIFRLYASIESTLILCLIYLLSLLVYCVNTYLMKETCDEVVYSILKESLKIGMTTSAQTIFVLELFDVFLKFDVETCLNLAYTYVHLLRYK